MILTYTFDGEDFSYEVNTEEAEDYILRTHEPEEIIYDYLQYIYPTETEKNKEIVEKDYGFDGTEKSISNMDEESLELLSQEVVYDLINSDLYNPELEDYFEEEAYEQFTEDPEADWLANYNKQRL